MRSVEETVKSVLSSTSGVLAMGLGSGSGAPALLSYAVGFPCF